MSITAQISVAPDTLGRMVRIPFLNEAKEYLAYRNSRFKQDSILSRVHRSLPDFPRLCILCVDIVDYTAPIIEDEYSLIRIEPNQSENLRELLQAWGISSNRTSDYTKFGKYVFAFGLLHGQSLEKYLRYRYSSSSNNCKAVLVGGDTTNVDWLFQNQPSSELLEINLEGITDWLKLSLIKESVSDIATAVSFKSPDFPLVKFSRISHSADYMENGTIKFDGLIEEKDSLQRLSAEFAYLHDSVCYLQNHPDLKEKNGAWKDFRMFLLAIANMLESDHMLLPTPKMIQKNPDWQFNYDFWHEIRQFMENCCKYVLGHSIEVGIPQISYPRDKHVEKELKNLVTEIDRATKTLHSTLSEFIGFEEPYQIDETGK